MEYQQIVFNSYKNSMNVLVIERCLRKLYFICSKLSQLNPQTFDCLSTNLVLKSVDFWVC